MIFTHKNEVGLFFTTTVIRFALLPVYILLLLKLFLFIPKNSKNRELTALQIPSFQLCPYSDMKLYALGNIKFSKCWNFSEASYTNIDSLQYQRNCAAKRSCPNMKHKNLCFIPNHMNFQSVTSRPFKFRWFSPTIKNQISSPASLAISSLIFD